MTTTFNTLSAGFRRLESQESRARAAAPMRAERCPFATSAVGGVEVRRSSGDRCDGCCRAPFLSKEVRLSDFCEGEVGRGQAGQDQEEERRERTETKDVRQGRVGQ